MVFDYVSSEIIIFQFNIDYSNSTGIHSIIFERNQIDIKEFHEQYGQFDRIIV
jgi:hypothetical protein